MLKELKDTVVHCKTQEEYEDLVAIYKKYGWSAYSPDSKYDKGYPCVKVCDEYLHYGILTDLVQISLQQFLEKQGLDKIKVMPETMVLWENKREREELRTLLEARADFRWYIPHEADSHYQAGTYVCGRHEWNSKGNTLYQGYEAISLKKYQELVGIIDNPNKVYCCEKHGMMRPEEIDQMDHKELDKPVSTSFPKPRMSMLQQFKASKLSAGERNLRKTGLRDDCGNWTEEAVEIIDQMNCEDRRKELEEMAKLKIAEDKK